MKVDLSSINRVYFNRLISTIFIIAICVALFFIVRMAVHYGKWPKWTYLIWLIATMAVSFFTIKGVVDLHCDINEKAFVTYEGEFINRGGSQRDLKTIVIFDEFGKEIKLLSGSMGVDTGTYNGVVVYGQRSKIVVQIIPEIDEN